MGRSIRHARRATRRIGATALLVAALTVASVTPVSATPDRNPEAGSARADRTPTNVIVRLHAAPGQAAKAAVKGIGGEVRRVYHLIDGLAATIPANALDGLRRNPLVESVELDRPISIADHVPARTDGQGGYPHAYEYNNAWGVSHIGADDVHDTGNLGRRADGTRVKVAVIDTGIDYIHDTPNVPGQPVVDPEFLGNYAGGVNLRVPVGDPRRNDPMDDHGHGTHVAGIIAAERNGYLIAGVAPDIALYGVKILDATGNGEYSDLIAGLQWSVDNGMDVVNMSLGAHDVSPALAAAVTAASQAGLIMVGAAGNTVTFWELIYGCPVVYPAAYPEVLAVTFTNPGDTLTGLSCTGPQVDLGAPGDQIASTVPVGSCAMCSPLGYAFASGTSMAAPHVAGTVALILARGIADAGSPGLIDDIRTHLCATASTAAAPPVADPKYRNWYGCGILDANRALIEVPPPAPPGGANRPPVANPDSATTAEDAFVDVNVLANDTDPDGDPRTVTGVGTASHGTTTLNPSGTVRYTPAPNYFGPDGFTYTIADGRGGTATGSVTVTVLPVNDLPVAVNDARTTPYQTPVVIDVLTNDSDIDGDPLAISAVSTPANGVAAANLGGTITYTPNLLFQGVDAFTYTITDGQGGSASATVSITVQPPVPPPTQFHVGDLDNASTRGNRNWTARVVIRIDDTAHQPLAGVVVTGSWSAGATGSATCTTGTDGTCQVQKTKRSLSTASVTFSVTAATLAGWTYLPSGNHDPDSGPEHGSTGTVIVVLRP